jgi:carbon monoxide dehydrogenase subunit G
MGEVTPTGEKTFQGILKVRVGPVSLTLSGNILVLEQDRENQKAMYRIEAADRRIGASVRGVMSIHLQEQPDGQTELAIDTDATFMGKLGELGQPVIRHKARTTLDEFARNLAREIGSSGKPETD